MISVVVPTHNPDDGELERAIASIRTSLPNAQIIVVDDGSQPPPSVVGADALVRTDGLGPGGARNRGAEIATEPWLLFLDDDDELLPGARAFVDTLAQEAKEIGLICAAATVSRLASTEVEMPQPVAGLPRVPSVSLIAGSFVVARHVFDEVGGYDSDLRFGENTDLVIRCAAISDVLALDVPTVHYYAQATERRYDQRRMESAERLLSRGRADLEHRPTKARIHAVAAVNAARVGQYRKAQVHSWRSFSTSPSVKGLLRVVLSLLGPVGGRWWNR